MIPFSRGLILAIPDAWMEWGKARGIPIDEVVWGIMLGGLVCSSIHLMSMFLTRWGERHTSKKAFVFSLLTHLTCLGGAAAVAPASWDPDSEAQAEQAFQLQNVLVDSDERIESKTSGNTPVWDQLTRPELDPMTRTDRSHLDPQPIEEHERDIEMEKLPELDTPDLAMNDDDPESTPEPVNNADEGPTEIESVPPLQVDEEVTADARPEVQVPSSVAKRSNRLTTGLPDVKIQRIAPQRGSVERISPELMPDRQLATIEGPSGPVGVLAPDGKSESMTRRSGPLPGTLESDEAGASSGNDAPSAGSTSPAPPRFTRIKPRNSTGQTDGSAIERTLPDQSARSLTPADTDTIGKRNAIATLTPDIGTTPNDVQPELNGPRTRRQAGVPSTYRLRNLPRRKDVARKFGGTEESEKAVEASLRWLSLAQSSEGYWDADAHGAGRITNDKERINQQNTGAQSDAGVTALAVLAFLGAGYTHEEGQYAEQLDRAIRWLIENQHADGFLGGTAGHYDRMYCHAMATYAIAEAYGMQNDPTVDTHLREPITKAIAYIIANQNQTDGGWRYTKDLKSDMSMFGWQLMALKSADIAGIPIPSDVRSRMEQFLIDRSLGKNGGLAAYRVTDPPLPPTPSMTAEALFCKQMLGISRTHPACREAVGFMMQNLPKRSEHNEYYWYYGTLAMYQYGGEGWKRWNESLRDLHVEEQRTSGDVAGSWDPLPPWGPYGGRVYSTALSTLCLEVYYRFLPLYQMGGQYDEK
ncbi:MAG: prenyltransferase/squalene oxidase repeat-containing protein [Planctomycetaceae bacterium]